MTDWIEDAARKARAESNTRSAAAQQEADERMRSHTAKVHVWEKLVRPALDDFVERFNRSYGTDHLKLEVPDPKNPLKVLVVTSSRSYGIHIEFTNRDVIEVMTTDTGKVQSRKFEVLPSENAPLGGVIAEMEGTVGLDSVDAVQQTFFSEWVRKVR